jgi:hypothetical protein
VCNLCRGDILAPGHTGGLKPKGRGIAERRGEVGERLRKLCDVPQCGSTCPSNKVKYEPHRGGLLSTVGDKSVNNI